MLTKWITISFLLGCAFGVVIPIVGYSIICMLCGNFDPSTWYFPYDVNILLDSSTVAGWYLRAFHYFWGGTTYSLTVVTVISYMASCCFYVKASCRHLQSILDACDETASSKCDNKDVQTEKISEMIKVVVFTYIKVME